MCKKGVTFKQIVYHLKLEVKINKLKMVGVHSCEHIYTPLQ